MVSFLVPLFCSFNNNSCFMVNVAREKREAFSKEGTERLLVIRCGCVS